MSNIQAGGTVIGCSLIGNSAGGGSGPTPPPPATGFPHEMHFLNGLPVHMVRFGFQPTGTAGPPTPPRTGFPHGMYMLSGLPVHMIRFGFMPVGQAPAAIPQWRSRYQILYGLPLVGVRMS